MPLSIAGMVAALQGIALAGLGMVVLIAVGSSGAGKGGGTIGVGVLLLLMGFGLGAAGLLLARCRPAARGPVVVAQLIGLALAWQIHGDAHTSPVITLSLSVTVVVVLLCLLTPSARHTLARERSSTVM